MSNLLTTRGMNDLASFDDIASGLGNVAQSIPTGSREPYLRMGKDGIWIYGAENVEVEEGSRWAIHPFTVEHGYVCWSRYEDGRANVKLGEVMVPSNQPAPPRDTLVDKGFPWTDQVSFQLVCTTGEDKGTQTKYSATSVGGLGEIKNSLLNAMIKQIAAEKQREPLNATTSKIVPVVTLDHSSYTHKTYGKIYTPIFNIIGWGTLEDQSLEDKKPAPAAANNGAPQAGPEAAAEAPRRRNRVRA